MNEDWDLLLGFLPARLGGVGGGVGRTEGIAEGQVAGESSPRAPASSWLWTLLA